MEKGLHQYRDLADWSDNAWEKLDIHLFIAANFSRYCRALTEKVGTHFLHSDTYDNMLSLYCEVAFTPLQAVHRKNRDARGQRRNQIMLGTLKMITYTRMVEALIREYPATLSLAPQHELTTDVMLENPDDLSADDSRIQTGTVEPLCQYELESSGEEERLSRMLERVRPYLTPLQYHHLRYAICDRLDPQQIAELTGRTPTNVRIMLANARKRMLALVPPELYDAVQDCLHRQ